MGYVGTKPMKSSRGWPIVHLNGATAKATTLKNGTEGAASHWIDGYILDGALATGDGFHICRRSCLYFNTTDTWTAADGGTTFDWGTEAASGHFALEVWVYIPSATGAHATLMKRGNEASDGWLLEVDASGYAKFTAHDSAQSMTITGATSVFDKWTLITVVAERNSATGLNLYVDGVSDATAVDTTALDLTLDGGTTIVSTGVSGKDNWLGPVGLYIGSSANLSAATVLANYNGGLGRKYHGGETGLAAAWNNDEGTGTICYDVLNNDGVKSTVSGTAWSPAKQSGATAALTRCGPPFENVAELRKDTDNPLGAVGLFGTGVLNTEGWASQVNCTFPEAIDCGPGNHVKILETNGAFSLILFGRTE
ncbi:MAG: LamG-like jellyroll fold domain-containing protein [Planctomycetota bacterium]